MSERKSSSGPTPRSSDHSGSSPPTKKGPRGESEELLRVKKEYDDTVLRIDALEAVIRQRNAGVAEAEPPKHVDKEIFILYEKFTPEQCTNLLYEMSLVKQKKMQELSVMPASVFTDEGDWPTATEPPSSTGDGVTFIKTTHGPWVQDTSDNTRMVRHGEYPELWDRIKTMLHKTPTNEYSAFLKYGMLVLGNPGIGKTLLLDVLLSWMLYDFPSIPVVVIGTSIEVFTHDGHVQKRYSAPSSVLADKVERHIRETARYEGDSIIILHDIKDASVPYRIELVMGLTKKFCVRCVMSSAPKQANHNVFQKDFAPEIFVLPVLTREEAKQFSLHKMPDLSDECFEDHFDKVGGVPRHLVSRKAVEKAVLAQTFVVSSVAFDPQSTPSENSDRIVRVVPLSSRKWIAGYDFVSARARRKWIEVDTGGRNTELLRRYHEARNCDFTRDVLGRFFQDWILHQLRKSSTAFSRAEMGEKLSPLTPWDIPSLKLTPFFGETAQNIIRPECDTLYVPRNPSFSVVDAVIVTKDGHATLIQVTIADRHPPTTSAVDNLFQKLKRNKIKIVDFVWIVDLNSRMVKKPIVPDALEYDAIKHFLCRYDDPMCWVVHHGAPEDASAPNVVGFPVSSPSATLNEICSEIKTWVAPGSSAIEITQPGTINNMKAPFFYKMVLASACS